MNILDLQDLGGGTIEPQAIRGKSSIGKDASNSDANN